MIEDLKRRYAKLQGLLNTPIGQSQGGLLSNIPQGALLGSAIFGQGIQGKDPFSAFLPAVTQTAQLQKYMTPEKIKQGKPSAYINKETGIRELVTPEKYAENPDLYLPDTKTPLMAAAETEEQKFRGKLFGQKLLDIDTAATSAIKSNTNIDIIESVVDQTDLKTGIAGNLRTTIDKIGDELGFDFDFQNVGAAEVLTSTTGKIVLDGLANFKGAISDGERNFVKDINVGLGMSKAGIKANLTLMRKGNKIALEYDQEAKDWSDRNGGLSKKDKVSGKSWNQFTNDFHKQNPLVTDEERKILQNLSRNYDSDFIEGNNVQTIDGVQIVEVNGKLYKLK
jgi:hypothetical protein